MLLRCPKVSITLRLSNPEEIISDNLLLEHLHLKRLSFFCSPINLCLYIYFLKITEDCNDLYPYVRLAKVEGSDRNRDGPFSKRYRTQHY
jgi:hypothetical protein